MRRFFFVELGKIIPRQDGGFFPLLEGGAAVDEPRGDGLAGELGAVPGTLAAAAATDGKLFVRVAATPTP